MSKRSSNVASLLTDEAPIEQQRRKKSTSRPLPGDLAAIEFPRHGVKWFHDPVTVPLRLRVSRRGLTWIFHGRVRGAPRRVPLGKYPRVDIEQARALAARKAAEGGSVSHVPVTFAQLRLAYFDSAEFKGLAPRTQRDYKNKLNSGDYSGLAPRRVRDIARADLLAIKDAVATDGRVPSNVLRVAQAIFSWAEDRGLVETSPALRLKLPANKADPRPFVETEIYAVLTAADKQNDPWRAMYRLCAYTGLRPSAWGGALWREIDWRNQVFTVAPSRARRGKLKQSWNVPLSSQVMALLRKLEKRQGKGRNEMLFGREVSIGQRVRDAVAEAADELLGDAGVKGAERGTPYRFRSTLQATMTEWGVAPETQERLVGHKNPFMQSRGHYVPPLPTKDMHELVQRYATWIDDCVSLF